MKKVKGIVFAAVSAATFGLIPLYANQAIIDGVNNETILVYRYGIAGLLYAIYLWISKVSMRLSLAELREVLIAGVGGYGITAFFLFLSYHYMPTGYGYSFLLSSRGGRIDGCFLPGKIIRGCKSRYFNGHRRCLFSLLVSGRNQVVRVVFCIDVDLDLRFLYCCFEPSRTETDKSRCPYLLCDVVFGCILFFGRGRTREIRDSGPPGFRVGYVFIGFIKYYFVCSSFGCSRKIDRSCTEFRVRDFRTFDSDYRWCFLFSRAINLLELCRIDRCYCCGDDRHL